MIEAYDNIKKAQGVLNGARDAASEIAGWAKNANRLVDAGKELSEVQDALKGVKMFSKISTAFALASVGLDLALYAVGLEAPTPVN
jgi:hypothetical protein